MVLLSFNSCLFVHFGSSCLFAIAIAINSRTNKEKEKCWKLVLRANMLQRSMTAVGDAAKKQIQAATQPQPLSTADFFRSASMRRPRGLAPTNPILTNEIYEAYEDVLKKEVTTGAPTMMLSRNFFCLFLILPLLLSIGIE